MAKPKSKKSKLEKPALGKSGAKPSRTRPPRAATGESPTADVLTVCWLVSALFTLVCEVGAAIIRLTLFDAGVPSSPPIGAIHDISVFAALVIGACALALTMPVYRTRVVPPPRNVTIAIMVIGLLPIVVLLVRAIS